MTDPYVGKLVYDEHYSRIGCVQCEYELYTPIRYYLIDWCEERADYTEVAYPETMVQKMIDALGKQYEQ